MSDDGSTLPRQAQRCPNCSYDLHGTLQRGGRRCPECGFDIEVWQLRELYAPNVEGEPLSLSPRELRFKGSRFLAFMGVGVIVILAIALVLLRMLSR